MNKADKVETLPTAGLVPYARNARTHSAAQIEQIARSIREFGFTNPVLITAAGGIVAGHGRVLAAQSMGLGSVPCLRVDWLTEAQRRAYVLADNKIAMNAGWDEQMLAEELRGLREDGFDMDLMGFSDEELDGLAGSGAGVAAKDPDECPDVEKKAVSCLGDIWAVGEHRVMCGDSTTPAAMGLLMAGVLADLCWTDPPYNVAYGDKAEALQKYNKGHRNTNRILNDDLDAESFGKFLAAFYRTAWAFIKQGGGLYVAHSETERAAFTREMLAAGFKLSGVVIWKKNALVLGRSDYQWMHEPILYGWKEGKGHRWFGGRKNTTVVELEAGSPFTKRADGRWEINLGLSVFIVDGNAEVQEVVPSVIAENKPTRNDIHPTMKPVALIERMLRNSGRTGDVVLDPFGGSGSTLMAAERLHMRARVLELSPVYVDVIIRRWQTFTGARAVHAVSGQPFPD
jgi:DNA modification methylase